MTTIQITAILMAIGVFGCFLPFLPGPPIVWLGALYYAWQTSWAEISILTLVVLFALALAGSTADVWMSALGAKKTGASIWGTLASVFGGVIGLFTGGIPGLIIGSLAGIAAVEYYIHRNWNKVFLASKGYLKGFILSFLVQFVVCLIMIGIFWMAVRY